MSELQIKVYTTPNCGGCKMLKGQVEKSKYKEIFEFIDVTTRPEEKKVLDSNGIASVPAIFVNYKGRSEYLIGFRPINVIDDFITECIRY